MFTDFGLPMNCFRYDKQVQKIGLINTKITFFVEDHHCVTYKESQIFKSRNQK